MSDHEDLDPERIMDIGTGFLAAKTLLVAVDLELFTFLSDGGKRASVIEEELGLHPRATRDFLDALLSLDLLERDGTGGDPVYSNTPETAAFLDKNDPRYVGGSLELSNKRLYEMWGNLDEALRTGQPQNEVKDSDASLFEKLYEDPERLEAFLEGMEGSSKQTFRAFADQFDFSEYDTLCDIGGALANLSRTVVREHPHLSAVSLDLPEVTELARERIREHGLSERVEAVSRDFLEDEIPEADLVTASRVLHDLGLEDKKMLLRKAYEAVRPGGAFVAIDAIIDDERREHTAGLLESLVMLVEFGEEGFDYTGEQFTEWATEAGFEEIDIRPLSNSRSMAIAHKS